MTRLAPFDVDGLWVKARLFINRSLDDASEFEEAAFWACCALELLGKSALARLNPLLIALPSDDGHSLLVASGAIEDTDSFVTVQAKTVWARCGRAFREFSQNEARELSLGRNAYIHSAAIGFDVIPAAAWWPRFWTQANVLVARCGRDISDFVGDDRAAVVHEHLATNRANLDHRLRSLLEDARLKVRLHTSGSLSGRMFRDWQHYSPLLPWERHADADCPACGSVGTIGGDEVVDREVEDHFISPEDGFWDARVTLTVATSGFQCNTCHLELLGSELTDAADLPTVFQVEGDFSDVADLYESEYNNE